MTKRSKNRPRWPIPRVSKRFATRIYSTLSEDLSRFSAQCFPHSLEELLNGYDSQSITLSSRLTQSMSTEQIHKAVAVCRLLGEVTRKYTEPSSSGERKANAINAFKASETACSKFNTEGWLRIKGTPLVQHARAFVRRCIGVSLPPWADLVKSARNGPGTSIGNRMAKSHKYFKLSNWPYTVTFDALDHARSLIECDSRWLGALEDSYRRRLNIPMWQPLDWPSFWEAVFEVVPGNRVTTVPKDSVKDRTIAIEPTMNMMLQLGIDGFVRRRLKRWHINLDDQSRNCVLAHEGSVTGRFATLDLSAASDTVSLRICKMLLPSDWFEYVCAVRSPRGALPDGSTLRYSKVSSMGNGDTFAFESLIFTAVVYASMRLHGISWDESRCAVYGDDLIVPSVTQNRVRIALELCGFSLNSDKSFGEGPFRESCGTDWYEGHPVRAVYLKERPASVLDLFRLHNALMRWSYRSLHDVHALSGTLAYVVSIVPHKMRYYGPCDDEDLASYLHDPSWRVSTDKKQLESFKRFVLRPQKLTPKEWFFGRLLSDHKNGFRTERDSPCPPFRWRGQILLRTESRLLNCHSSSTRSYEVTLRTPGALRLVKGYRSNATFYDRSVSALALCRVREHSRQPHRSLEH